MLLIEVVSSLSSLHHSLVSNIVFILFDQIYMGILFFTLLPFSEEKPADTEILQPDSSPIKR